MDKKELLNFAKGIIVEPKNSFTVSYYIDGEKIVVTSLEFNVIKNETDQILDLGETEIRLSQQGESNYKPTADEFKKAWIDFFIELYL